MKILIADDTEDSLELLKVILESEGHQVTVAKDGFEALELAKASTPELVISDLLMPKMDGFLFLQNFREDPQFEKVPFIVYTATYTDCQDEDLVLELGANRFLLKPMEPSLLIEAVNRVVERSEANLHKPAEDTYGKLASDYSRRLASKLEKKISELAVARAAKDNFLGIMCHELRTPLNGVLGLSELLLKEQHSEETRQFLEMINNSGKQLLNVFSDIIDVARMNQSKLKIQHKNFSLSAGLKNLEDLFAPSAAQKGLEFSFWVDPRLSWVQGDPIRLSQVLSNLLSNAVKFTSSGKVESKVSLVEETSTQYRVNFEVIDTGQGISPQFLLATFEPFGMVDDSSTRELGGSGLGLSIVKNLVELMGGTIEVDSELGQGSRFHFELTLEKGSSEQVTLSSPG